jgi:hypothetical protein
VVRPPPASDYAVAATLCHAVVVDSSSPAVRHLGAFKLSNFVKTDDSNAASAAARTAVLTTSASAKTPPECACAAWTRDSEVTVSTHACLAGFNAAAAGQRNTLWFNSSTAAVTYHHASVPSAEAISDIAAALVVVFKGCVVALSWKESTLALVATAAVFTAAAAAALANQARCQARLSAHGLFSGDLRRVFEDGQVRSNAWTAVPVSATPFTPLHFYGANTKKGDSRGEHQAAQRAAIFASLDAEPGVRAVVFTPSL